MTTECPTCEDCKEENERWCGQCHEELQTARHWLRFPGEMPEQQAAMIENVRSRFTAAGIEVRLRGRGGVMRESPRTRLSQVGIFSEYLRKYAMAWGKASQIVSVGDIVTAHPDDWGSTAQVRITSISCRLITLCHGRWSKASQGWEGDGWQPELELQYCGRRLRKDGLFSQAGYGNARVLNRFTLPGGAEIWAPSDEVGKARPGGVETFNTVALSWELERATPEQLAQWDQGDGGEP